MEQEPGCNQEVRGAPVVAGSCEHAKRQAAGGNRLDGRVRETAQAGGPGLGKLRVMKEAGWHSGFHRFTSSISAALQSLTAGDDFPLDYYQQLPPRSSLAQEKRPHGYFVTNELTLLLAIYNRMMIGELAGD
jgi:hypothetical protein